MASRQAALITGGAIRLGRAFAIKLAELGYDIIIHYNSSKKAAIKTQKEIEAFGVKCQILQCNFSETSNLEPFISEAISKVPNLSLLVNNASSYIQTTIAETSLDAFDHSFNSNFKAPFFLTQAFTKLIKKGEIINIIDNKIHFNQYEYSAYLLAKKALAELTKMAALEFAPNFKINGLAPGVVLPLSDRSQEYIDWRVKSIPLKKQGKVSALTQGLASILANEFMTGQILTIDGGEGVSNTGKNAANYLD